jgi:hypothetical protein
MAFMAVEGTTRESVANPRLSLGGMMSGKDKSKGKGIPTSGIPLPGGISQMEDSSVETNNFEAANAFKEDQDMADPRPYDQRDFIGDEEEQMGDRSNTFIANKDDEEWSDGMEDECNLPDILTGEDADAEEGLFPETGPLHIDLGATAGIGEDDDADMILRPDTMDDQPDDASDIEVKKFKGTNKKKKSA